MNVLILSTFPPEPPTHGGQHRVRNIAEAYRSAGFAVQCAGVLSSPLYPATPGFVAHPGAKLAGRGIFSPQMEEFVIGELFASDDECFAALCAEIAVSPDVVQVEQPWLMKFAIRLLAHLGKDCRLVYDAYNIEHAMKFAILREDFDWDAAEAASMQIARCEVKAIETADAVISVARPDAEWARRFTDAPVVVAPNGVAERETDQESLKAVQALSAGGRFALFSASAHPPNLNGFFAVAKDGWGGLAPGAKLVIVGSAGPAILADPHSADLAGREDLVVPGLVSESMLAALLESAHVIILPVLQGGGTNLKTAEALWSGKHVLATSKAMRGFEAFADAPGVHIADGAMPFQQTLRAIMAAAPLELAPAERERRRALLWQHTLSDLPALLQSVCAKPSRITCHA